MIRSILFLFLCTIPASGQTIKEQTQRHLMAMTNISAIQVVNNKRYVVAMFGNRQVFNREIEIPRIGIRPGSEWYSLLQDSQFWKLLPAGDHFTYSDTTRWFEISRMTLAGDKRWDGLVACEGEVYVVDNSIVRITQRFTPNRLTTSVSIDMVYEWVELKERRLLPTRMTMTAKLKNGQTHTVQVQWIDYKEFGSELLVKDVDTQDTQRPIGGGGDLFAEPSVEKPDGSDVGLPTPFQTSDVPKTENERVPSLLDPIGVPHKTNQVSTSSWKNFFKRLTPKL
jgi:hypothetical protein